MTEERYTPYPNALLERHDIERPYQDTLIRILSLCWKTDHYEMSKPMTLKILMEDFPSETTRRTLDRHVKELVRLEVLVLEPLAYAVFRLGLHPNYAAVGHPRPRLVMDAPSVVLTSSIKESTLIEEDTLKEEVGHECPTGAELAEMIEFLSSKGVSQPALTKIPGMDGVTLEYLHNWWAYADYKGWVQAENGRVINKIYSGNPVPEFCTICGGTDGEHKYLDGLRECPRHYRPDLAYMTDQEIMEFMAEVE